MKAGRAGPIYVGWWLSTVGSVVGIAGGLLALWDGTAFGAVLSKQSPRNRIAEDVALAARLEVRGTPTVFLDGKRFGEWDRIENWRAILAPAGSRSNDPKTEFDPKPGESPGP